MRLPNRLTLEMLERIIADAVMVNLALLTAFALRFLSFFVLGAGPEGGDALQTCILTPASSGASRAPTSASPLSPAACWPWAGC